jgi:phage shock protein E
VEGTKVNIPNKMLTSPWLMAGLFLVGLTAILAIWFIWTNPKIRALSDYEARAELRSGAIDTVIDVRTQDEWTTGHYPHAIHIPLSDLVKQLPHHISDRSKSILFICKTGRRAAMAAATAQDLGYTHIQYLNDSDYKGLEPKHNILNV